MRLTILLILSGLLRSTLALCPGFNYAFLALQYSYTPKMWPYDVSWKWVVTDAGCGMQLPPCIDDNPCSQCWGLGCSPAPVHVDKIEVNGLWYLCRPDVNAGSCQWLYPKGGGEPVSFDPWIPVESCCRNDGRRNLAEGLISKREFDEIEATNAMLDIHKREYAEAVESGMSDYNITALRDVQMRELKEAEARQLVARNLED